MRCFVSIPVPDDARAHLDAYLDPRRDAEPELRWSAPERWHVTLAFLPDVSEVDVDDLEERLAAACRKRRPMTLRLRGGGVFGGAHAARVLWTDLGVDAGDREELERVAVGARHAASAAGTVVEGGRFVPHVTVARSPRPRNLTHLLAVLDLYEGPTWDVSSVDLVASHGAPGPVHHEVLGTYPLGEPEDDHGWWRKGFIRR